MSTYIIILIGIVFTISAYLLLPLFRIKLFDKYFQIYSEENYNLDDLFSVKIQGKIIPKVDFLDIPYEDLDIEIDTKTIRGSITDNVLSLKLIRPSDRRISICLVKTHYIKAVRPYIKETIKNKKEYIDLIKISTRQKHNLEKIACRTCKHRVQCQISFTKCNYERADRDTVLRRGMKVDTNRDYELNRYGQN